ncbi:hypothetical protein DDE83_000076 [Stemphylium lycopersici]|uniref:DUF3176 domain containing protein n=1 Tax=Stemphylium lycopersici TaxID=183478 RepID=A0A364NHB7_STELY|nr:hypothetical protein DDE83_000076 [Stemphylium lycopersici]
MLRSQHRLSPSTLPFTQSQVSHLPPFNEPPNIPPPPPPPYQSSFHKRSSFDFLGRIEQKLAQYNASQNIFKRWLFEIISITTSAICMGTIIGLLYYLDDQSLGKWPPGLTIITILSKIATGALILPISEAIGQLKWAWFHGKKSRDAFDFEIFDKASRGAWGSFLLLYRTKGRSLAALGALLTVFLLAIDTFFQQVTDLPERWRLQGESFIPRSIRYEPKAAFQYDNTYDNIPVAQVNNDLRRALNPFFYDENGTHPITTGQTTQAEIPLICPTSRYGFCLEKAMAVVTTDNPVLMSGFRLENDTGSTPGETLLMRTLPLVTNPFRQSLYGGSINFKNIQNPLLDAFIVSSIDGTAESVYKKRIPVAQECVFSWCVKKLRSSYESGGYKEDLEDSFVNTTSTEWPWWTQYLPEQDMIETEYKSNISIIPPSMEGTKAIFGLSNITSTDFTVALDDVFPSMITVSNATAPPFIKIRTSFTDQVMFRAVSFSPWLAPNNVTHHFERMARAMTNVIRSDANSNELVAGSAYARETYIAVHWAFLTFPLAMLVLSVVFLVATILKTSNDSHEGIGNWKTSAMPTLMYGLPKDIQERVVTTSKTSRRTTNKRSSKVRIRLHPKQGWRVSGQVQAGPTPPPGFI